MFESLAGKVAIVTGGAMGIGLGIVKRFVDAGMNVQIVDINAGKAAEAAEKLKESKGKAVPLQADLSQQGVEETILSACERELGPVDLLVNNAGIYPQVPMLDMNYTTFDKVYQINLRGLAFLSRAVAKSMIHHGKGGKIINIASIDSFHPSMVGLAAYDASKGGVVMFTKSLALEVAPHNILVNAIAPGGITTEGTEQPLQGSNMSPEQMKEMMEGFARLIPLRRMGVPDDIAKVALFLASDGADYITGETIIVDGGRLLS